MTLSDTIDEFKLNEPPTDCIQCVKFGKHSNQYLLTASWDNTMRVYDIVNNKHLLKFDHPAPVLDCVFQDSSHAWSACMDKLVRIHDISANNQKVMGYHRAPVRCMEYSHEHNLIISGSWDSTIKLWDQREPEPIGTYMQPDKVYTLDICNSMVVVGTAERHVIIWDLRNMSYAQQRRESSLKYQTRYIRCSSNKDGFVMSSIEGRVAVEYFDPAPEIQKKKYAFKCHRGKDPVNSMEYIYPVNSISFHSLYNTFATGGSDGFVNIWDAVNKKRICLFHKYPTNISSVCFSPEGEYLAIASSYMHDGSNDKIEMVPDSIFIRKVSDQEAKPK